MAARRTRTPLTEEQKAARREAAAKRKALREMEANAAYIYPDDGGVRQYKRNVRITIEAQFDPSWVCQHGKSNKALSEYIYNELQNSISYSGNYKVKVETVLPEDFGKGL